ncbi:MAG: 4-hydroxy-tetrahydrodipicolinate reductase [Buchnera aphidicola (Chaetogeoica yunlongensis)]
MTKQILKIAISGALGRMGKILIKTIKNKKNISLTTAIVKKKSPYLQQDIGLVTNIGKIGIPITDSIKRHLKQFNILIDFTNPKTTLENLEICAKSNKNIIIGTTGFTKSEQKKIENFSKSIGIVQSSNYSIGINLIMNLLEKTTKILGENFDIEIIEAHHNQKIDSPSGTAIAIGKKICKTMNWNFEEKAVYARKTRNIPRTKNEIGFSTIRAGNIIGEHKIIFANSDEHIEIKHKAITRSIFAKGAIHAALWLFKQNNLTGLYNMNDVLKI